MIAARLIAFLLLAAAAAQPARADMATARDAFLRGDYPAALAEFRRLAEQGDVDAQTSLAEMHMAGRGTGRNLAEAVKWFRTAAELGDDGAQANLGLILAQRSRFPEAVKWLTRAADQGNVTGLTNLAALHMRGLGVERNPGRALALWARAAAGGDPQIQLELGLMYLGGAGGKPDTENGLRWLTQAARQGFSQAQTRLGMIYIEGSAVAADKVKAYKWLRLASMQGAEDAAAVLEKLADEMTPQQIAAARRGVAAWTPGGE